MNDWSLAQAGELAAIWNLSGKIERLTGERDCNFRITRGKADWVLKISHPDEAPAVAEFQTMALVHLAAHAPDLPIPSVLQTAAGDYFYHMSQTPDGRPRLVRVVSWLDGRPMGAGGLPSGAGASLGSLMARLDLGLAGFAHPAQHHHLVWDLSRSHDLRDRLHYITEPALRGLAQAALEGHAADWGPRAQRLRKQIIHNDMNPHNILLSPVAAPEAVQLAGIIDFGDMVSAPLINELGVALSYQLLDGDDPLAGAARIAAAYHRILPLTVEEVSILPGLMAARMAATVTTSHWMAAQQPHNRDYLLRNMQRAASGLGIMARTGHDDAAAYFMQALGLEGAMT